MPITSHTLLEAIENVTPHTVASSIFQSPASPEVFVHPVIEADDGEEPFAAEVILISASGGGRKDHRCPLRLIECRIPFLDLAQCP